MVGLPYFLAVAVLVTAVAAWFDWRTGEMPNAVTLGPLLAAPLAHGIATALAGGPFQAVVEAAGYSVLGAAVCACLIAFGQLAYNGKLFTVLGNTFRLAVNPFLPKEKRREITPEMMTWARFGPAIFLGTTAAAVLHWRSP